MEFAHNAVDAFAVLSVIAVVAVVLIFVYSPSNKERFDKAAESILRDEDRPWSEKRDRRRR
jgi:cytochrome c oxidase cbb3-type subunit IV